MHQNSEQVYLTGGYWSGRKNQVRVAENLKTFAEGNASTPANVIKTKKNLG